MPAFKRIFRAFAGTTLLFSGLVGVGTSLVLFLSSCIGYLPYSDRPGPGWWGRLHRPSWAEFAQYIGFAPWFAYFCLYFGLGLFVLSLLLGLASTPRWMNRALGGVISALAAGVAVAGAGWYFALAAIGPNAAIFLGLLYGALLFPYFVHPRTRSLSMLVRAGVVLVATSLFIYWIVLPFLPRKPIADVQFELIRITPGDQFVASLPRSGTVITNELRKMGLHGQVHGGISGLSGGSGNDAPRIEAYMVALEPITKETRLVLPSTGSVLYVLKDGEWTAHPAISDKDKRYFTIKPGDDKRYEGGQVKVSKESKFSSFTWFPVIPLHQ